MPDDALESGLTRVKTWVKYVHPNGSVYFHHPKFRVTTTTWIYEPEDLQELVTDVTRSEVARLGNPYFATLSETDWQQWEIAYESGCTSYVNHKDKFICQAESDPGAWIMPQSAEN